MIETKGAIMLTSFSEKMFKRKENDTLDDYIFKVLQFIGIPACVNTLTVVTGIPTHRLCKILNRLEMHKKIRKITNVYHAYWQPVWRISDETEGKVCYQYGKDSSMQERMDYLEFIARETSHDLVVSHVI